VVDFGAGEGEWVREGEMREAVTLEDAGGASIFLEIVGLPDLAVREDPGDPGRFSGEPKSRGGVALRGGEGVPLSISARRTREGEDGGEGEE
jgi:hypothetical protein